MPLPPGQVPSRNQLRTLRHALEYYHWQLQLLLELAAKHNVKVTL